MDQSANVSVTLCVPVFEVPGGVLALAAKGVIEAGADVAAAMFHMKKWNLPPLYHSGVRYALEPQHGGGTDEFALPPQVYQRRWGDCDDLVIWRVAELRALGEPAGCSAEWVHGGVHVLVRRANGLLEDPSIILGGPIPPGAN